MLETSFDRYEIRARLKPVLFVLSPMLLFIAFASSTLQDLGASLILVLCAYGASGPLICIARDLGRKREATLPGSPAPARADDRFDLKGAKNLTIKLLRLNDPTFPPTFKKRIHKRLVDLCGGDWPGSVEEEAARQLSYDETYESAVHVIRSRTRDWSKFSLLLEENVEYGFRRNLFGLRAIGIALSGIAATLSVISIIIAIAESRGYNETIIPTISGLYAGASFFFLSYILTWRWVEHASYEYGRQLIYAVEQIDG